MLAIAFGTLIIAGIVARITFLQYKIHCERHRFELYGKRFSIYDDLKSIMLDIIKNKHTVSETNLNKIYRINDEAVFLFDDDITQHINNIKTLTLNLYQKNSQYVKASKMSDDTLTESECDRLSNGELAQLGMKIDYLKSDFDKQFDISHKKFFKYLKFEIIKYTVKNM
ncbi:MAG: hypothetical protein GY928_03400 [Colwellia sp.]|nr:hypothetical protein [Colwellia sp.]